jgi:hypothetical protein
MKVKLIKKKEGWYNLYQDSIGIASTHEELQGYKLSLKNCQAIERGYDLYELIDHITPKDKLTVNASERRNGFLKGFQKCLELMNDKKFSEEELLSFGKKCFYKGFEKSENDDANCYTAFREEIGKLTQSLQQTEWDVEIEKENVMHDYNGNISLGAKFNLDADGCLILKLKSE